MPLAFGVNALLRPITDGSKAHANVG